MAKATFKEPGRVLDALITRTHTWIARPLSQKIFFLHLHKCGGTSISHAIKDHYHTLNILQDPTRGINAGVSSKAAMMNLGQAIPDGSQPLSQITDSRLEDEILKYREKLLAYYLCQSQVKYISGHFCFSANLYDQFSSHYNFITVLRHPIQRLLSFYYFSRYKSADRPGRITINLQEYLETRRSISAGYYVRMLGGVDPSGDYQSKWAISRAKENLHKFKMVGFLENLDSFQTQFFHVFGRKLGIKKLNHSPKPQGEPPHNVTADIEAKLREICRADIEVYNYAKTVFA
ncbi:MAG: sulfotransferase family 2 domain-containing protein [Cyanobacteria bacterium P01_A01_bin.17]